MTERMEAADSPATFVVHVAPPIYGDLPWRARALDAVRRPVELGLRRAPDQKEFTFENEFLKVTITRTSGKYEPGRPIRLEFAAPGLGTGCAGTAGGEPGLRTVPLPDERIAALGRRLVGCDPVRGEIQLRLRCQWTGLLPEWMERTGTVLSPAALDALAQSVPLFILAGDPGTGKTAVAQACADRYCRESGNSGQLIHVGTEARGGGLVGDFGNRVRAAFAAAERHSALEPCFLLLDEADAVAMRRSERQAHHEDRAGTATLLQALDALHGRRVAVFLTTNLLDTVDPAVRRRGTTFLFKRPGRASRREIVSRWLPDAPPKVLDAAAMASRRMTPADLERSLRQACLEAAGSGSPLDQRALLRRLWRDERTGRV